MTPPTAADAAAGDDVMRDLLSRLDISERLLNARLETIDLDGEIIIDIEPQARSRQSDSLTPKGLTDLISSIGVIGQLQPIIVEEHDGGDLVLIAGERRLSAMTQGRQDAPDNPHFSAIRALVVPGPLSEWERRAVQLAENFARRDLTESDLGRALWYARCALLIERVRHLDHEPPAEVLAEGNPVERWKTLNEWRSTEGDLHNIGANWDDTVKTLGVELSEDRADEIAKAFRDIGEVDSEVLDELNASTRARKQVRAAKNEGLDAAVAELIEAVNDLRDGEEDVNPSRLLEEGAKRLRVSPDTDPRDILDQVVADQKDREARKAAAAAEADDDGDDGQPSGSAFHDDQYDEDGELPPASAEASFAIGGGAGDNSSDRSSDGQNHPVHDRLAETHATKTLKSSQARRLIQLIAESAQMMRDDVVADLEDAIERGVDLSDFDRNSLKLELDALASAVEAALTAVGKAGIAEGKSA
jgi:ParB family transcriptional regulator, chromosome partitioning protein